ncbi:hypothetical protein DFH09DRAFT_1086900 [Mycena vulgaris]|nr:hypothetical protein DFH09DRAFT_1086900 [Mycena vulgaris]
MGRKRADITHRPSAGMMKEKETNALAAARDRGTLGIVGIHTTFWGSVGTASAERPGQRGENVIEGQHESGTPEKIDGPSRRWLRDYVDILTRGRNFGPPGGLWNESREGMRGYKREQTSKHLSHALGIFQDNTGYGIQSKFINHHANGTAAYAPGEAVVRGLFASLKARAGGRAPRSVDPVHSTSADVGRPSVHVGIDVPISCRQTQPRLVGRARRHVSPDRQAVPMGPRNAVTCRGAAKTDVGAVGTGEKDEGKSPEGVQTSHTLFSSSRRWNARSRWGGRQLSGRPTTSAASRLEEILIQSDCRMEDGIKTGLGKRQVKELSERWRGIESRKEPVHALDTLDGSPQRDENSSSSRSLMSTSYLLLGQQPVRTVHLAELTISLVQTVDGISWKPGPTQGKAPNLYVAMYRDGVEAQRTPTIKRSLAPNWNYLLKMVFHDSSLLFVRDKCLGTVDIDSPL